MKIEFFHTLPEGSSNYLQKLKWWRKGITIPGLSYLLVLLSLLALYQEWGVALYPVDCWVEKYRQQQLHKPVRPQQDGIFQSGACCADSVKQIFHTVRHC